MMFYINVVISLVVMFLVWGFTEMWTIEALRSTSATLSSISGMLFGFVLASLSVLTGMKSTKFAENMKLTGHYTNLLVSMRMSAGFLLLSLILSLTAIFLPGTIEIFGLCLLNLIVTGTVGSLCAGFVLFFDMYRKFHVVIQ